MRNLLFTTFILVLSSFFISELNAQTINEAFRYSQYMPGSTARLNAMAGSFGAMGGDIGVLTINPAGIAAFRESEFTFTPSLNINQSDTNLRGGADERNSSSGFGLDNIGAVFVNRPIASNWITSNFAIGLNKVANFNEEFIITGDTPGSITDRFVERANGLLPNQLDNFEAGLAFDALAIFPADIGSTDYFNDFFNETVSVPKTQTITRSGKLNDLSFGWAGNYKNKFSVGATIGIPLLEFEEVKIYEERSSNENFPFRDLFYTETLTTTAGGLNFSAGVIYKPVKNVRLGASLKSPNWYFLSDDFDTQISYTYLDNSDTPITTEALSPINNFDYRLSTPWRYTISAGTLFKKDKLRGLFNLDVDFLNYSNTSFNLTSNNQSTSEDALFETELNELIQSNFTNAVNIKLGGEIGYNNYRFRAGYGIYGSAYESDEIEDTRLFSLGAGVKYNKFYMDVAYQAFSTSKEYRPYFLLDTEQEQVANVENSIQNISLTFGFEF